MTHFRRGRKGFFWGGEEGSRSHYFRALKSGGGGRKKREREVRRKERLPNEVNAADRGGGERNGMERRNFRNVRMNAGKSMSFLLFSCLFQ